MARRQGLIAAAVLACCALGIAACSSSKSGGGSGGSASTSGSGSSSAAKSGTYYWLQGFSGNPTSELAVQSFLGQCKTEGLKCAAITSTGASVDDFVNLMPKALAKGDALGIAVWGDSPAYFPYFKQAKVPIVRMHFYEKDGYYPGKVYYTGADPAQYAKAAADSMCTKLKADGNDSGTVAITQASSNVTENAVSSTFTTEMKSVCPSAKVLGAQSEGTDAPAAVAKAVSIIQAHSDIVAALSTTGGGAATWSGAQTQTGKKITVVAVDYTRQNLDLVKSGKIFALIGQPVAKESQQVATIFNDLGKGKTVEYYTKLEAPIITKDGAGAQGIQFYYDLLNKIPGA
ncbi:MAG: ribose transport system substrate-binding protein [Pseudonocardiales bacterium]|nr:ribose transport system substrate-binding protein [Pseudonocardiales bacterium]